MLAAGWGVTESVQILLDDGANLDLQNQVYCKATIFSEQLELRTGRV